MTKWNGLFALGLATLAVYAAPAMAQNLLLNPGFEDGYTTNWILSAGTLNGIGLGEDPHSGTKSWHGAWNWGGSAQTTTYYQDVAVTAGSICTASMWCKANAWGGVYGNDTHSFRLRVRFLDAGSTVLATHDATSVPNDTYQQLVLSSLTAPSGTVACRVMFSYITTQMAHAWKVWNIDDLSLTVQSVGQHAITGMTPKLIADNSSNTIATIAGVDLTGASAATLTMGATVLNGAINSITPDGLSMSVTFPTAGAPAGKYDVTVSKTGFDPSILTKYFTIRGPGLNLLQDGDFEAVGPLTANGWSIWSADRDGISGITKYTSPHPTIFQPSPDVFDGTQSMEEQEGGNGEGGTLQVVDVIPGEQLVLDWVWMAGDQADGVDSDHQAWHAVGIQSGVIASAQTVHGDVDEVEIKNINGQFDWTAVSRPFTVPAGVTQITVYTKTGHCCVGTLVATRFDNVRLMTPGSCATQHTISAPVSPVSNDNNNNTTLTVTGTDLNLVTNVLLIPATGGPSIVGTNRQVGVGNTTLTASFATAGAKADSYHVRTDQAWPCAFQFLSNAFTLTCPDSSGIAPPINPAVIDTQVQTPGLTLFTIDGANLDLVSAVRLSGPQTINGSIQTQAAGQITANFDLTGAALGKYTLTATRTDGCQDVVLVDAFEMKCGAGGASHLATVDAWGGMSGTNPFTFDLTGTGLQSLTQVRLVKLYENNGVLRGSVGNPVLSTSLVPNVDGTRLTVTMDLTDVEGGRYKVDATHPCGLVTYASGFADGPFLVWMPFNSTPGPNGSPLVFQNPSFEEAYNNSTNPGMCEVGYSGDSSPKAKHWDQVFGQRVDIGSWSRDKSLGFGAPPFDCGPNGPIAIIDGEHYEDQTCSARTSAKTVAFFQTADISPLVSGGVLAADLTVRAIFSLHCSGEPAALSGYIEIHDGPENGGVLATSVAIPTLELKFAGDPAWQVTVAAGTPINAANIVTVVFRGEKQVTTADAFLIMRVDNVYTGSYVQPGCHLPFADFDGDQDVDQADFAAFQACYTGQGGTVSGDCLCFDRKEPGQPTSDGDIDQTDMQAFEACASGAGVPANPACGN